VTSIIAVSPSDSPHQDSVTKISDLDSPTANPSPPKISELSELLPIIPTTQNPTLSIPKLQENMKLNMKINVPIPSIPAQKGLVTDSSPGNKFLNPTSLAKDPTSGNNPTSGNQPGIIPVVNLHGPNENYMHEMHVEQVPWVLVSKYKSGG
jgi:hypothetical protein